MTPEQKLQLETSFLKKIDYLLAHDSLAETLGIIKFAKDNQLFFPQLYEFWYTSLIGKYVVSGSITSLVESVDLFGVSQAQRNTILGEAYKNSSEIIEAHCQKSDSYHHELIYCFNKLLALGVFFEDSFFKNELFNAYFNEEARISLENNNIENRQTYLESQLQGKSLQSATKL